MDAATKKGFALASILAVVAIVSAKAKSVIFDNMTFDFLLPFALKWECNWVVSANAPYFFTITGGAYTDNKKDKGGETKWGIAKAFYPNLDIKNMTYAKAVPIYKKDYWERYRVARVPQHLRMIFFDAVVNHGGGWSTRELQKLAGVKQDGIIGVMTQTAAAKVTVKQFAEARRQKYYSRVKEDVTQSEFLDGWLNRVNDVEKMQNRLNNTKNV